MVLDDIREPEAGGVLAGDVVEHSDAPETSAAPKQHRSNLSTIPALSQLAVALSILGAVFVIPHFGQDANTPPADTGLRAAPILEERRAPAPAPKEIAVAARAAFVWDVERGRAIYNKNADEPLALASLTKLMTALVATETLTPEGRVAITPEAIMQEGESGFYIGELFTIGALRDFTLVSSSNDGAYALAAAAGATLALNKDPAAAFVDTMNIRAEQIGLIQTHFENPTGLDTDTERSGSYGTARDMARLMEYLLQHHPDVLEPTTDTAAFATTDYAYHAATNTNVIVPDISKLLGSKTGFTDLAGGNLAVAYNIGLTRPIVVIVLGSTREGRFSDTLALIEYAAEYISAHN